MTCVTPWCLIALHLVDRVCDHLCLPPPPSLIGLFFHKFGHMSAVVGLTKEPLQAVWYDSDLSHAGMGPNDVSEHRLGSGPADGAAVNMTTVKGGVDYVEGGVSEEASKGEGDAKRGRALGVLEGRGLEEHWQTRSFPEMEGSEEAGGWGSGGASEERFAGDAGGGLRGRRRERYVSRRVLEQKQGSRRWAIRPLFRNPSSKGRLRCVSIMLYSCFRLDHSKFYGVFFVKGGCKKSYLLIVEKVLGIYICKVPKRAMYD